MGNVRKTFGISGPLAALALIVLAAEPAWAGVPLPGPAIGGLGGAAIVGALVIAKLWRRK